MGIVNGRALKQRYWSCCKGHEKVTLPWDHDLHPAALEHVAKARNERARYKKKIVEEGKTPGKALLKRTGWAVGKPENKL
jgi:hypothetical protein